MDFFMSNILTFVFALPFLGAAVIALIPKRATTEVRVVSLAFSLSTVFLSIVIITMLQNTSEFQFMQAARWMPQLGIAYRVGVDGTSALLVLMTALMTATAIATSETTAHNKVFFSLLLIAQGALIGAFIALDVFLFFVCSEILLIPFFFIIGFNGSNASRHAASTYTAISLIGSALFLIAMITMALINGNTFDLITWYAKAGSTAGHLWLFAAFALACCIRMAIVPFHAWLIDASSEAPFAGIAYILATSIPLGAYGLYRFAIPLFPTAVSYALPAMLILALVSIIYAALSALAQDDARRVVAFASIVSAGMLLLGLFAFESNAVQGTALGMFSHGITFGTLALLVGLVTVRMGTSRLSEFSGLARSMPFAATATLTAAVAAAGLPLLAMFSGWFCILLGSFQTSTIISAIATAALIIVYAYTFLFIRRMFFGPLTTPASSSTTDLDTREIAAIVVLIGLIIAVGVWPRPWFKMVARSSDAFAALAKRGVVLRKAPSIVAPAPEPKQVPLKAPPPSRPRLRIDTEQPVEERVPVIEHKEVTLPPLPAGAGEDKF